jgi:microcystin-dependent protein
MSAPVTPAGLLNLIPSTTADKCTAFVKALVRIPLWLYDFFNWLITSEGDITTSAQNWLGVALPGDTKFTFDPNDQRGWLDCNGATVSRTTYADLFAAIGIIYGAGDSSTTFRLPDFRGRVPGAYGAGTGLTARSMGDNVGEERHTVTANELPAHTHDFTVVANNAASSGQGELTGGEFNSANDGEYNGTTSANTTTATPMNVMQPTLFLRCLIKY